MNPQGSEQSLRVGQCAHISVYERVYMNPTISSKSSPKKFRKIDNYRLGQTFAQSIQTTDVT